MKRHGAPLVLSALLHITLIAATLIPSSSHLRLGTKQSSGSVEMLWSAPAGSPSSEAQRSSLSEKASSGLTQSQVSSNSPRTEGAGLNQQPSGPLVVLQGAPQYPSLSRRAGEEGKVTLKFTVNRDGTVQDVLVHESSGYSRLDQAAVEFLRSTRLDPRQLSNAGKTHQLSFVFSLKN